MAMQIETHRARIAELCRRYRVRRLDVFGSAVRDDFDDGASDVDFLVEFLESRPEGAADRYFGLHQGLQEELHRPVDLVVGNAIRNPYFQRSLERQARLNLYVA